MQPSFFIIIGIATERNQSHNTECFRVEKGWERMFAVKYVKFMVFESNFERIYAFSLEIEMQNLIFSDVTDPFLGSSEFGKFGIYMKMLKLSSM